MKSAQPSLQLESLTTLFVSGATLLLLGVYISHRFSTAGGLDLATIGLSACVVLGLVVAAQRTRKRLLTVEGIERRLHAFSDTGEDSLLPLLDRSPVGSGWNRLVDQIRNNHLDQQIERRLAGSTSSGSEKFARTLRSLPEGIAISDPEGTFTYSNPAWQSLLGLDAAVKQDGGEKKEAQTGEDKESTSLIPTLESVGFTNLDEIKASLLQGSKPLTVELKFGSSIAEGVLQLSRVPLEGRKDEPQGFAWLVRNVTQMSLARESHEQFLAAATHELRTPLTNIKAYSESLLDLEDISPDQQRSFFNVIHSEANRLGRLLNQLLDIQQLEAGSMTLRTSVFDIQRMLQEVREHIAPLVEEKQLRLNCRIAPNIKAITGDKEKLISCLVNLLGNAVKYTPEGGEVALHAEQLESCLAIHVEDTGIGIAEEDQAKIFERFYRCQDDRVDQLEGNGLGLAFALEVAHLHGGEIQVESELDKGSRFSLRLPTSEQPAA